MGRSSRLTGTIAWMRLGRPTPAGVGASSAVTRRSGVGCRHGDEEQRHGDGDDPGAGELRVIRTMIKTMAVKVALTALIACERRILGRELLEVPLASSRCQCRTIPSWERVKDTKTPMMKADDRADVAEGHDQGDGKQSKQDDAVAVDEAVAAVVQLARQEAAVASGGSQQRKPLKAVLAAKIKMAAVAAWR